MVNFFTDFKYEKKNNNKNSVSAGEKGSFFIGRQPNIFTLSPLD